MTKYTLGNFLQTSLYFRTIFTETTQQRVLSSLANTNLYHPEIKYGFTYSGVLIYNTQLLG